MTARYYYWNGFWNIDRLSSVTGTWVCIFCGTAAEARAYIAKYDLPIVEHTNAWPHRAANAKVVTL